MRTIIVDDEKHCIEELKTQLSEEKRIDIIDEITNSKLAVERIIELNPDLVFLDIQMPAINGFDIIKELKSHNFNPCVVFVTAYDKFAIQAIKSAAFDYLLKPVDKQELKQTLKRLYADCNNNGKNNGFDKLLETVNPNGKIKLNNSGGFMLINPDDIIYIEADWNYSKIYTGKAKFETITTNLGNVEKILPPDKFFRINRSNIINTKYLASVKRLSRKCILLKDKEKFELKISLRKIRELEGVL